MKNFIQKNKEFKRSINKKKQTQYSESNISFQKLKDLSSYQKRTRIYTQIRNRIQTQKSSNPCIIRKQTLLSLSEQFVPKNEQRKYILRKIYKSPQTQHSTRQKSLKLSSKVKDINTEDKSYQLFKFIKKAQRQKYLLNLNEKLKSYQPTDLLRVQFIKKNKVKTNNKIDEKLITESSNEFQKSQMLIPLRLNQNRKISQINGSLRNSKRQTSQKSDNLQNTLNSLLKQSWIQNNQTNKNNTKYSLKKYGQSIIKKSQPFRKSKMQQNKRNKTTMNHINFDKTGQSLQFDQHDDHDQHSQVIRGDQTKQQKQVNYTQMKIDKGSHQDKNISNQKKSKLNNIKIGQNNIKIGQDNVQIRQKKIFNEQNQYQIRQNNVWIEQKRFAHCQNNKNILINEENEQKNNEINDNIKLSQQIQVVKQVYRKEVVIIQDNPDQFQFNPNIYQISSSIQNSPQPLQTFFTLPKLEESNQNCQLI